LAVQALGRPAASALRLHQALRERPVLTLKKAHRRAGMTFPTAAKAMAALMSLGIARELTGGRRNRVFVYDQYLTILNQST
jgi:Fic family protein